MKYKKDYNILSEFWNNQFLTSEEDIKRLTHDIKPDDWKNLSPSRKLFDAITNLGNCKMVLDYGCGNGWSSFIAAKSGNCFVKGVDVSSNGIKLANAYKKIFNLVEKIEFEHIDPSWIKSEEANKYDGFFCSNVIDVIPNEMAVEVIKEVSRIVKSGAIIIFSFNFYIEPALMEKRGAKVIDNKIYINDVLRLVSYTDEELKEMFSPYFKIKSIDYFSWPGEEKETRRLFILTK